MDSREHLDGLRNHEGPREGAIGAAPLRPIEAELYDLCVFLAGLGGSGIPILPHRV